MAVVAFLGGQTVAVLVAIQHFVVVLFVAAQHFGVFVVVIRNFVFVAQHFVAVAILGVVPSRGSSVLLLSQCTHEPVTNMNG